MEVRGRGGEGVRERGAEEGQCGVIQGRLSAHQCTHRSNTLFLDCFKKTSKITERYNFST